MAVPQERLDFLRAKLEQYAVENVPSVKLYLTKDQYDEVIRININHANDEDNLLSFYKHCLKYIFILYKQYEVLDTVKFETEFGSDGRFKTSTQYYTRNERTWTPDGNIALVALSVVAIFGLYLAHLKK